MTCSTITNRDIAIDLESAVAAPLVQMLITDFGLDFRSDIHWNSVCDLRSEHYNLYTA